MREIRSALGLLPTEVAAKWINAVPAIGVGLALALTLFRRLPTSRSRGDRVRIALASLLVVRGFALKWL